jgi:hypothetical protein
VHGTRSREAGVERPKAATLAALDLLIAAAERTEAVAGATYDRAATATLARESLAMTASTPHASLRNSSIDATVRLVVVPLLPVGAHGAVKLALGDERVQVFVSGQVSRCI